LNYETVKYFTNEDHEVNQYDRALSKWEEAKNKNRLSLALLNSGQSLIISIAIISLLYLSANEVLDNTMTIGDFVLINAFMMQLFMPLNFLGFVYREIRASLVNIEQMFNLLQVKPAIQDAEKALEYKIKDGAIRFENVFFTYPNCRPALSDVTFSVPAGAKIGIVGESGAGKSTITRLLFRFYDPEKGKITIDNIPITNMTLRSLRSQIAMVPQDCVLFNTSIIENIRYGRPDASDDEIYEVIRAAHLDKLIARLPDGVDTLVGERGLKLSGGEKQRIAIARAMLKKPRILVLDEATSSLDSESEEAILGELNEISKGITTLAIAHRLSTIADAECILVMQNGRIIEVGSHDDLLNQQGYYAKLWSIQKRNK
jgi:ATP-binding cassette subfamily B protein